MSTRRAVATRLYRSLCGHMVTRELEIGDLDKIEAALAAVERETLERAAQHIEEIEDPELGKAIACEIRKLSIQVVSPGAVAEPRQMPGNLGSTGTPGESKGDKECFGGSSSQQSSSGMPGTSSGQNSDVASKETKGEAAREQVSAPAGVSPEPASVAQTAYQEVEAKLRISELEDENHKLRDLLDCNKNGANLIVVTKEEWDALKAAPAATLPVPKPRPDPIAMNADVEARMREVCRPLEYVMLDVLIDKVECRGEFTKHDEIIKILKLAKIGQESLRTRPATSPEDK